MGITGVQKLTTNVSHKTFKSGKKTIKLLCKHSSNL